MSVSSPLLPKRPRGAQPGNRNAFRHGFYIVNKEIIERMNNDMKGDISDEIIALRSLIDTTLNAFAEIVHPSLDQCLATLHGVGQAFETMRSLYMAQKFLYHNQSSIEEVLDELAKIPVDQD